MTGLRMIWNRYFPIEETIRAMVYSRLALPVSGGAGGDMLPPGSGLPLFLGETMKRGAISTAAANWLSPMDLLVQMLGCTAAFLTGFCLWWGFYKLCGLALAGKGEGGLGEPARWAGSDGPDPAVLFHHFADRCCCALSLALRSPHALLELEKSLLAEWAWQLFGCLGIWH